MTRFTCVLLVLFLLAELTAYAGVGSKKTQYVGGTITSIKAGSEGKSSTGDEKVFVFEYKKDKVTIPYRRSMGLSTVKRRVAA
jgi:hypothetical protein